MRAMAYMVAAWTTVPAWAIGGALDGAILTRIHDARLT